MRWFFIRIVSMLWFFIHIDCIVVFHTNCSYVMIFLYILFLLKLLLVWKGVMCLFGSRVKMCEFCGYIVAFKIIFSMEKGYVYVWGTCKNVWVLQVFILKSKSIQAKKCPRIICFTLLAKTWNSGLNFFPRFYIDIFINKRQFLAIL